MDLFEYMRNTNKEKESPLAARLRPSTLDEVVGQQHIIGKDKLLYRAIKADKLSSLIFYGPPGTGKTTLANQCNHSREEGYGGGCREGQRAAGDVWKADHSVYR